MFDIAKLFRDAGYEFYYVGGYVRDILMGGEPNDMDATTNATPDQMKGILSGNVDALYDVGARFGTIACIVGGQTVEITTYRTEQYNDSRKPEVLFGNSLVGDLSRRDFTMNAIAYDPHKDCIIDPFGGRYDIKQQVLRAVGNAYDRMKEDPLRMLRAVRFAAKYNMHIAPKLTDALFATDLLDGISRERIREELDKMLLLDKPSESIYMLKMFGMLSYILPSVNRLDTIPQFGPYHKNLNVFEHTMEVLDNTLPNLRMRLAALFHDTGKYATAKVVDGRSTFIDHETYSDVFALDDMKNLRYSAKDVSTVRAYVLYHMLPYNLSKNPTIKAVRRFVRKIEQGGYITAEDLMCLNYADIVSRKSTANWSKLMKQVIQVKQNSNITKLSSPLNGDELMRLFEMPPGPWIKGVKDYLTGLLVDGELNENDKEKAQECAERFMERQQHRQS